MNCVNVHKGKPGNGSQKSGGDVKHSKRAAKKRTKVDLKALSYPRGVLFLGLVAYNLLTITDVIHLHLFTELLF